jgi:pantetheine-phosphate adenylyltransferase
MNKKAIYPGSFDPFTNGHLDIVKKSAAIFDQVYVVIGVNAQKKRTFSAESMIRAIEKALADANITNVVVTAHAGLVAQYAKEQGIGYMIRGLRNNMDYNYEENIAEVNKLINPAMESVYFRADNVAVSSFMVKELHSFGLDVSPYLPKAVYDILQKK